MQEGLEFARKKFPELLNGILKGRSVALEVADGDGMMANGPVQYLEVVLEQADVLIITAPHRRYAALKVDKPVVDVWNLMGRSLSPEAQVVDEQTRAAVV